MAEKLLGDYVQFYTTKVPAEQSQGDIIATLHRYGASGFGFRTRGPVVEVTFHIPDPTAAAGDRTVVIPINVDTVHERLHPKLKAVAAGRKEKTPDRGQSERVAWRVLLSWINAALSAVAIGAQTLEEAFHAHMIVETTDGQRGRMIDYVHVLADEAKASIGAEGGRLPALGPGRSINPGQLALPPGGPSNG
jgi:hypothetical protein